MNSDHDRSGARRRVARLGLGAVIAAAALLVAGPLATSSAGAAPRTKSTAIADTAERAVESLHHWQTSQNPIDYVVFVQHRDQAAAMSEVDLEITTGSLRAEWDAVSLPKQEAILRAVSQLGVPYQNLASEPGVGFDCSGLTIWAFGEAGMELSRISRDQINESVEIDERDAEAGDLVYYPGHISIYLGADMMVHAPNSGSHVEITDLPERSLRFGDAAAAHRQTAVDSGSLMDRALAVTE